VTVPLAAGWVLSLFLAFAFAIGLVVGHGQR
jgi:hypothetical protein